MVVKGHRLDAHHPHIAESVVVTHTDHRNPLAIGRPFSNVSLHLSSLVPCPQLKGLEEAKIFE